jgi:uncharacterized membrane protein YhiD involved in acid resistance
MDLLSEDWLSFLLKLVGAFLLALPVAWDREKSTRIMGLRTFPIVLEYKLLAHAIFVSGRRFFSAGAEFF